MFWFHIYPSSFNTSFNKLEHFCFSGMGLQAFVEAFFFLAARRFKSVALKEQVSSMLELCEAQLESQSGAEDRRSVSCSRALPRANNTQTLGPANSQQLDSLAPLRRAASQDYRLHQRLKPGTLRAKVENWCEGALASHTAHGCHR